MTLCTKEAWGDIMSLFSGGLASDNEGAARRARKTTETGIGAANAAATKAPALDAVADEALRAVEVSNAERAAQLVAWNEA